MPKLFIHRYNGTDYLGATKEVLYNNIITQSDNKGKSLGIQERLKLKKELNETTKYYDTSGSPKQQPTEPNRSRLKMSDAINGAKAFIRLVGGDRVEQEEINRRAGICSAGNKGGSCPKLAETSNCKSCGGFMGSLLSWVGKLKAMFNSSNFQIPNGLESSYCDCCGCSLALMLPSKIDAFKFEKSEQLKRPSFCWLKRNGMNFKVEE